MIRQWLQTEGLRQSTTEFKAYWEYWFSKTRDDQLTLTTFLCRMVTGQESDTIHGNNRACGYRFSHSCGSGIGEKGILPAAFSGPGIHATGLGLHDPSRQRTVSHFREHKSSLKPVRHDRDSTISSPVPSSDQRSGLILLFLRAGPLSPGTS